VEGTVAEPIPGRGVVVPPACLYALTVHIYQLPASLPFIINDAAMHRYRGGRAMIACQVRTMKQPLLLLT
jgi:hypothetical protein